MQSRRITLAIAAFLFFCLAAAHSPSHAARGITWYEYEKGKKKAARSDKKILMYFRTGWCGYCKKMEKQTFKNTKVVSFIKKNFVPVMIDGEKDVKTAAEYGVFSYPAYWFLSPEGAKLRTTKGYIQPDIYLQILKFMESDSYETMKFNEYLRKNK
jgi:thioredoxin-related protein